MPEPKAYSALVESEGVTVSIEVTISSGTVNMDQVSAAIAQAVGKVAATAMPDDATFTERATDRMKRANRGD